MPQFNFRANGRSWLMALQHIAVAFLAVAGARSQAENTGVNNSPSALAPSPGQAFSLAPTGTAFAISHGFETQLQSLAAYRQFQDMPQAFGRWWEEQGIARELAHGFNFSAFPQFLHMAVEADHAEAVIALIDSGANLTVLNSNGIDPINHAFNLHKLDAVKAFHSRGLIHWEGKDAKNMRPLDYALVTSSSPTAFIKALHQEGIIDFQQECRTHKTVRELVLDHDDPELFELGLLQKAKEPVDPQAYQKAIYQILVQQVQQRKFNIVKFVLTADPSQWTAPFVLSQNLLREAELSLFRTALDSKAWEIVEILGNRPEGFIMRVEDIIETTDKLNGLFRQAFKDPLLVVSTELERFLKMPGIALMLKIGEVPKIRVLAEDTDYGYVSFLKLFSLFASDEGFNAFCNSIHIDWTEPDTAQAKNWLLMEQSSNKVRTLYEAQKAYRQANVFDVEDIYGLKPVDWLLSRVAHDGLTSATWGFIEELEHLGVTHIGQDLISRPRTREAMALNSIDLLKRFLPEPSHPEYQKLLYDVAITAIRHSKTQLVNGILDLPGFDINTRQAGKTFFMAAVEAGALDIAGRLLERPEFNPDLRDNEGLSAAHHLAQHKGLQYRALEEKLFERDMISAFARDYSGKSRLQYYPNISKEESDEASEQGRLAIVERQRQYLEKLIGIADGRDIFSMPHGGEIQAIFNTMWEDPHFGLPKILGAVDPLESHDYMNLMHFVSKFATYEQFTQLLHINAIPWYKPEYAYYREVIFNRPFDFDIIEMLYRWGLDHGHGNVFDLPNARGLKPIHVILEYVANNLTERNFDIKAKGIERTYAKYEKAGIVNFERDFGVSLTELTSRDFAYFKETVLAKTRELRGNQDSSEAINLNTIIGRAQIISGVFLMAVGIAGYYVLPEKGPEIRSTPGPQQRPRKRRTPQASVVVEVEEYVPIQASPEDPTLIQARERAQAERREYLNERDQAVIDKAAVLDKKSEYATKANALKDKQASLARIYTKLAQVYEESEAAYQAYIAAVNTAIEAVQNCIEHPADQAFLKAKNAAILSLPALKTACQAAQANAQEKQSEGLAVFIERHQKLKVEKLTALSKVLTSDDLVLAKLEQLRGLILQTQGLDFNKHETEVLERAQIEIGRLETRLSAFAVKGFSDNAALPVLPRLKAVQEFCKEFEALANFDQHQPDSQAVYTDAKVLLAELSGQETGLRALLAECHTEIKALSEKEGKLKTRRDKAKEHYEEAKKLLAQIGLPEETIAPSLAIIVQMQDQALPVSTVSATSYVAGTADLARFEQTLSQATRVAGGAGESKVAGAGHSLPKDDMAAIRYTSQLICLELHFDAYEALNAPAGVKQELALLALLYNFARLLDLLKPFVAEARELRNQLIHRYYVARAGQEDLMKLIEKLFTPIFVRDDRTGREKFVRYTDQGFLDELKKEGCGEIGKWIRECAYYKNTCHGEDHRQELRNYPMVEAELFEAIKGLRRFRANKTIWANPHKKPLSAADNQPLLRDATKMQVLIIGEVLRGPYKQGLLKKLERLGCDTATLMPRYNELQAEDEMGNFAALQERISIRDARNKAAHEEHLVSLEQLFSVSSKLDAVVIGKIADQFASFDFAGGPAGALSLVLAHNMDPRVSRGAAGGSSLNPGAREWHPPSA